MEKVVLFFKNIKERFQAGFFKFKSLFVSQKTATTDKKDLNLKNITVLFFSLVSIFLVLGLFMPGNDDRVFRQVAKDIPLKVPAAENLDSESKNTKSTAEKIWGSSSQKSYSSGGGGSQINYNTSMVMGENKGNSKFELPAGSRMRIQIIDKFLVSDSATPIIAKLLEDITSMSGNSIPEGSLLYGEAVYQKASGKAIISFKRVSYPNGSLHDISAVAIGDDGMMGLSGNVKSDSVKNSVGQTITSFVGSMASGSVEKDFLGNSKGGTTNGLYQAIADTAKDRAQKFGESLKESREWIEVESGQICEAVLQTPYKLIDLDLNRGGSGG